MSCCAGLRCVMSCVVFQVSCTEPYEWKDPTISEWEFNQQAKEAAEGKRFKVRGSVQGRLINSISTRGSMQTTGISTPRQMYMSRGAYVVLVQWMVSPPRGLEPLPRDRPQHQH